ncbi:MAG: carboxypeptidase regulatory-like domain-containing protein [Holophagaceae bacterium]|nr:carboxypeptidase regulatory-like domain-containing protein [Holophagaceae bacterium]
MGLSARLALVPCLILAGANPRAEAAATGSLSGVLKDATGRPVPGADLRLISSALPGDRLLVTDGAGAFRFDLLLPGSYAVQVRKEGFQLLKASFIVQEGQEQKVQLTLTARAPRAEDGSG